MIRIKDIAARAGVSTTTVSNVIHHKEGKVSPQVAERIREMIREMGYVPSLSARMLAKEHSHMIGIVTHGLQTPDSRSYQVGVELINHLIEDLRQEGYYVMLFLRRGMDEVLRESLAWNFDGMICYGLSPADIAALSASFEKPIVLLDSGAEVSGARICQISMDDGEIGHQMGRYLLEKGHRNLFYVATEAEARPGRWLGFFRALKEGGISRPEERRVVLPPEAEGRKAFYQNLLSGPDPATALCFQSDDLAVSGMRTLWELGISVPGQISVAGMDDLPCARTVWPSLTTVHPALDQMAQLGVDALIRLAGGEDAPEPVRIVPAQVVARESVRDLT